MSDLGLELRGLYDVARLCRDLGVSRRVAEKIMRALPKQRLPETRKVWVLGGDVEQYLREHRDAA